MSTTGREGVLLFVIIGFLLFIVIFLYLRFPKPLAPISSKWKKLSKKVKKSEAYELIHQLALTSYWLSSKHIGALIVIEGKQRLDNFAMFGYPLKAKTTSELLISIFSNKDSALHDGGVIIRGIDVISVSTYFPVAQLYGALGFGARHRAALGITSQLDAIALVVSETKGNISIAKDGQIQEIEFEDLNSLSEALFIKLQPIYQNKNGLV